MPSTFKTWDEAMTWAIRKANETRGAVGIRWNEIFGYYSLSRVTRYERGERQWVSVVDPGTPHAYSTTFIGPFEHSA